METCGCKYEPILGPSGALIGGNIIYCAKHAAAFDLYGALKCLIDKTEANDYNYLEVYSIDNLLAEIDGEEIPFPDLEEKPPWRKT